MEERYIATADLGTCKFAVTIAKVCGENMEVIYYKECPSDGVRYGRVFNPKRAAGPLKAAIQEAENELGIKVLQLVIGLPRYPVRQEVGTARIERSDADSCISWEEVRNVKEIALDNYPLDDSRRECIYGAVAQSFSTGDMIQGSEEDIVGMPSDMLEGNFKIFVGSKKPVSNIDQVLNELGVAAARKCFLPNAVAKAVLTREEMENGVALIEIGGGVTSLTIYHNAILRYYDSIPFGGKHVTMDIKYECGFTEALAENIKLAFGACLPDKLLSMGEKIIRINDEDGSYEDLPVKYLSEIITCRAKEIVEAIAFLIARSGYAERLRNGIVITGGGANLVNIGSLIKEITGFNVRTGYPRTRHFSTSGYPGINDTGAASSVGLLMVGKSDPYINCITENEEVKRKREEEELAARRAAEEEEMRIRTAQMEEEERRRYQEEMERKREEEDRRAALEKQKQEEDAVKAETKDTVFDKGAFDVVEPQGPKKRRKPSGISVVWNSIKTTAKGTLTKAFDGTIGSLYDKIDEE